MGMTGENRWPSRMIALNKLVWTINKKKRVILDVRQRVTVSEGRETTMSNDSVDFGLSLSLNFGIEDQSADDHAERRCSLLNVRKPQLAHRNRHTVSEPL